MAAAASQLTGNKLFISLLFKTYFLTLIINFCVAVKDKAGSKPRQGTSQVKETVQEYIAGAESVSDDPVTRDYVVVRARLVAAK